MFNELYKKLMELKKTKNLINIFKILDKFKKIQKINQDKKLVYTSNAFRKKIKKFTSLKN